MNIVILSRLEGLAQDFQDAPRLRISRGNLILNYDYEKESGDYGEKEVIFFDVREYTHTLESAVTLEMLKAHNALGKITDSDRITNELNRKGYFHYIIYWEEYGAYEVIGKNYQLP